MSVQTYEGALDRGLEGVVACSTAISSIIDATLCYRGYTIEDLAENSNFEEVCYLLWNDKLPTKTELESFTKELRAEATLKPEYVEHLKAIFKTFPKDGHPMDFLKTTTSLLGHFDPDHSDNSVEATKRKALRLLAKTTVIVASFERFRRGFEYLEPNPEKSVAWNFLYLLNNEEPKAEHVDIFDTALVLHADHELNCSAFATRVTTSSLSDLYSAVVSAIGALKGPLHGGANTAVMQMLEEIGTVEKAKEFVVDALENKKKVMGIGHRVYKNGDPRAKILKVFSQKLTAEIGKPELYEMCTVIEDTIKNQKGLLPNVDFYSASTYSAMGIPGDLFTPIFAMSRVSGWCAHAIEQLKNNRIYRPRGQYTGEVGLKWTALETR